MKNYKSLHEATVSARGGVQMLRCWFRELQEIEAEFGGFDGTVAADSPAYFYIRAHAPDPLLKFRASLSLSRFVYTEHIISS